MNLLVGVLAVASLCLAEPEAVHRPHLHRREADPQTPASTLPLSQPLSVLFHAVSPLVQHVEPAVHHVEPVLHHAPLVAHAEPIFHAPIVASAVAHIPTVKEVVEIPAEVSTVTHPVVHHHVPLVHHAVHAVHTPLAHHSVSGYAHDLPGHSYQAVHRHHINKREADAAQPISALFHLAPLAHHEAPLVHPVDPLVHHAAPLVQHVEPAVHHIEPVLHHAPLVAHAEPIFHAPIVASAVAHIPTVKEVVEIPAEVSTVTHPVVHHHVPLVHHAVHAVHTPLVHHSVSGYAHDLPGHSYQAVHRHHINKREADPQTPASTLPLSQPLSVLFHAAPLAHQVAPLVQHVEPAVYHVEPVLHHAPLVAHAEPIFHAPIVASAVAHIPTVKEVVEIPAEVSTVTHPVIHHHAPLVHHAVHAVHTPLGHHSVSGYAHDLPGHSYQAVHRHHINKREADAAQPISALFHLAPLVHHETPLVHQVQSAVHHIEPVFHSAPVVHQPSPFAHHAAPGTVSVALGSHDCVTAGGCALKAALLTGLPTATVGRTTVVGRKRREADPLALADPEAIPEADPFFFYTNGYNGLYDPYVNPFASLYQHSNADFFGAAYAPHYSGYTVAPIVEAVPAPVVSHPAPLIHHSLVAPSTVVHHSAPLVHQAAPVTPVITPAAPLVHHAAPLVHHTAPLVHHSPLIRHVEPVPVVARTAKKVTYTHLGAHPIQPTTVIEYEDVLV